MGAVIEDDDVLLEEGELITPFPTVVSDRGLNDESDPLTEDEDAAIGAASLRKRRTGRRYSTIRTLSVASSLSLFEVPATTESALLPLLLIFLIIKFVT
jgi:hypothetical protein